MSDRKEASCPMPLPMPCAFSLPFPFFAFIHLLHQKKKKARTHLMYSVHVLCTFPPHKNATKNRLSGPLSYLYPECYPTVKVHRILLFTFQHPRCQARNTPPRVPSTTFSPPLFPNPIPTTTHTPTYSHPPSPQNSPTHTPDFPNHTPSVLKPNPFSETRLSPLFPLGVEARSTRDYLRISCFAHPALNRPPPLRPTGGEVCPRNECRKKK